VSTVKVVLKNDHNFHTHLITRWQYSPKVVLVHGWGRRGGQVDQRRVLEVAVHVRGHVFHDVDVVFVDGLDVVNDRLEFLLAQGAFCFDLCHKKLARYKIRYRFCGVI
jgi:hypothetical protein